MHTNKDVEKLADEFAGCQKILTAIGDENRLNLMLEMMRMGDCNGARVGDITEKTHLSRPAVGNKLTEEEQWAKLKLVKEIAEEVWG